MRLIESKKKILLFSVIFLILSLYNSLTYPQSSSLHLKFVHYSTKMGLSSNSQRCITQDKEGFIWIGTGDGLNRFDGYTFKVYRKNFKDTSILKSNIIDCLFSDSKGNLWVGTYGGGLSRYNKNQDNFFTYPALSNNNVTTMSEDMYHRLWIGTSNGLYMFNPKTNNFIQFKANNENSFDSKTVADNNINKIVDDDQNLWISYHIGTLSSLNVENMTFKHYKLFNISSNEAAAFSVSALVPDKNKIWISTWGKGIWIFDKTSGKCQPYKNERNKYIAFFFKDNKDRFWYSPESEGLVLINGREKINFQVDNFDHNSISSNYLSNIFQDRQGNLWITSKLGDLNYIIPDNPFRNWYKNPISANELSSSLVNTIIEDSQKRIWIGYEDGGIDIIDTKNINPKIHINGDNSTGLGPGPVMDIFESRNGTIWVGKYLDGLKKYNEAVNSFISYQYIDDSDNSIAGNDVRNISEDSHGNLWIAVHGGGIDKFNPATGKFIHHRHNDYSPSNSLLSDWTFTALCDKHDNIWVASIAGVSVLSPKGEVLKQYTSYGKEPFNLSNNMALIIYIGDHNSVWIGTQNGLNKLNQNTGVIKKYFTDDGLPSNLIIDILEDNQHNLWISTTDGLSKFSYDNMTFKNFTVQDGLPTNQFNKFASFKNKEGELYFGGNGGLTCFFPDSIKINKFKPPAYITDFKLFNQQVQIRNDSSSKGFYLPKQITYCREITLDYDQNVITLGFAALNYINLEKNLYKYKLEGFDNSWTSAGNKREVTYTNLDPGEYNFKVIASNNDGIWNTQGASLKIIVNPPFWRTNWAYGFYLLLFISMFYFFRRWTLHEAEIKRKLEIEELEIKKLHELDSLKMKFFSNVSHEFRTPLTLIIGPIEKLFAETRDDLQRFNFNLIRRNASRLLRLINQLMDFGKIEEAKLDLKLVKNDIVSFVKEIADSFNQDAKMRHIDFNFEFSIPSLEIWFDADKLDKIIFNLLSNAFKYTRDNGCIKLSLYIDAPLNIEETGNGKNNGIIDKTFKIIVKDTGIGIPKNDQSKIFERFYQINNTITTQGTGIGLSLTYELVELHKGKILFESEPNVGSTFTVILPLWLNKNELPSDSYICEKIDINDNGNGKLIQIENNNEQLNDPGEGEKTSEKSLRILIIEDNTDMRMFIKNEFKGNYNISEAYNGKVGLQKAFEDIPDAIICDVMMPELDGYEVCRTLKQDERTSHIPIVMLTARGSEQHTIEGLESGADDYIVKPFSAAILKIRIKNLIESRILLRKKFIKEPFASLTEISPSKTDEKLLKTMYSIVEQNLTNPDFGVDSFAYELGTSRAQLYRKINAISGQSVKEFIRIIRLKKAAELLLTSDSNISEIAYSVGFNSLSYFTSSFTEYFGVNPSKYIEKHVK